MTKINFDQDLMRNIRIIYGDADLDNMTLQNIYETWQRNPEIIRNTARQKMGNLEGPKAIEQAATSAPQQIIQVQQEIADDDLRGVQGFGTAFSEARKRGLTQFKWGKGVYGTQMAAPKEPVNNPLVNSQQPIENKQVRQQVNTQPITTPNRQPAGNKQPITNKPQQRSSVQNTASRYTMGNTVQGGDFGIHRGLQRLFNYLGDVWNSRKSEAKPLTLSPGHTTKFQQGGTMNNQQELQKAFVAYLVQDAAAQGVQIQSEQDLQSYAQQLGEEGIKAKYQEFMQKMQGGTAMARLGAKLQYYKKLKGSCPDGEEMVYFKEGGRICKSCQKKKQEETPMAQKGKKMNPVEEFKNKKNDTNPNDTVNTSKGPRDLNGKTKHPKWNPAKEQNSFEERKRVAEKDEKSGKKVFGSKCGSKMKKK